MKKKLLSREVIFYDPIQHSTKTTSLKKKETEKENILPQKKPPDF